MSHYRNQGEVGAQFLALGCLFLMVLLATVIGVTLGAVLVEWIQEVA